MRTESIEDFDVCAMLINQLQQDSDLSKEEKGAKFYRLHRLLAKIQERENIPDIRRADLQVEMEREMPVDINAQPSEPESSGKELTDGTQGQ